jgi:hypothetical protein
MEGCGSSLGASLVRARRGGEAWARCLAGHFGEGGGGIGHGMVGVGVLPTDLLRDAAEGIRLLEVREGLLRVRHLGAGLTH